MKKLLNIVTTSVVASLLIVGCGSNSNNSDNNTTSPDTNVSNDQNTSNLDSNRTTNPSPLSLVFEEIDVALNNQNSLSYTNKVTVNGVEYSLNYSHLMKTGHSDNGEIFGAVKDKNGDLITFNDGSPYVCNGTNDGVGSGLDFTSILEKDNKLYMVSQFECSIGAMYMAELQQESNGTLTPKPNTLRYIDQQNEFGGWTHCAGMTTPWQSHLGSEEYETDVRSIENGSTSSYYSELEKYWGSDFSSITPYYYGWITEVDVNNATPDYTKHYSMGRFSHELAYVMPDKKTVYLSDDGTNVGFYMFVADNEKDLSSGTLYGAKFTQTESFRGGAFDLSWVDLGHASDSQIRAMVVEKPKFSDIFEVAEPLCANVCPTGFTSVNTSTGQECLKVKEGQELAASRLETRRYAAMKGVTTEIRKEEGITYDPIHNRLYVAISEISRGMEDSEKYDAGGNNDIQLPSNICGAIYALDIEKNSEVNSNYTAKNFYSILHGEPKNYTGTQYEGNKCNVNGIANPDNLTYVEHTNSLIISEDTSNHRNNMVWSYNVKEKTLERLVNVPLGAEASGIFWYPNINDYSYLSLVTQHPSTSKESAVGLFSVKSDLNQALSIADTENDCKNKNHTWDSNLNQCFISLEKPDFSTAASNDTTTKSSSCYTTDNGTVFASNFECGLIQPWNVYSAASNLDWHAYNYNGYFAKITGYQADTQSDDWMISPKITFSGDEVLSFDYALNYSGSTCKVLVSTDYSGEGDPSQASWDTLTTYTESRGNWDFVPSGDFNLSTYEGQNGYIAFHHTNGDSGSGTWEIDNVVIKGSGKVSVPFQADFTLSDTTVLTGEYIEFTSSISGGASPYSFLWNLGNGATKTEETFCYQYPSSGEFNVSLTVIDANDTQTESTQQNVSVNTPLDEKVPTKVADIRVAAFNAYLNRNSEGELYGNLLSGNDKQVQNVAQIVQLVQPDVLVINEFDYNGTDSLDLLREKYLKVSQNSAIAIDYPYYYVAPSNTGIQTGLDVNEDGTINGNDAFGFGTFPGQYGMAVLSKYPIETEKVRTFQKFLWKDMPDANLPKKSDGSNYYSNTVLDLYRLSSKSHWDIPVNVNGKTIHILASHPTPPVFDDGDKDGKDSTDNNSIVDWNGLRNHDEIRLWADYIKGESYLYDDNAQQGGLIGDNRFVIMGDQNADPDEGDSYKNAIMQLLDNSLINNSVTPTSLGATSEGINNREPDDTAGWSMRADYVLPSTYGFEIDQCGVFWPQLNDIKHVLVEQSGGTENSSDHRLVWCDLNITDSNASSGNTSNEPTETLFTDFETGTLEEWTQKSLASDIDWQIRNYGTNLAWISGFDADEASNDWMISPELIFTNTTKLAFQYALNYTGSTCEVLISTDYDGTSNPTTATWNNIVTYTDADNNGNWDFEPSGSFDLSAYTGNNGYIAFKHTSKGSGSGESATWEIDDINITN